MNKSLEANQHFESLYNEYYSMVFQMCLGYMKGDNALAKDITQEVFINIWSALARFKGDSSIKTWIYRITVNTCLLYIRDNKKNQTYTLEEVCIDVLAQTSEQKDHQHSALYNAIGSLPKLDRLIIMMVLEELEYEEIAKITGINYINLRVKIHRIKKKMKELLKQESING